MAEPTAAIACDSGGKFLGSDMFKKHPHGMTYNGSMDNLLLIAAEELQRINDPNITQDEREIAQGSAVILSDFANDMLAENGWLDPMATRIACEPEIQAILAAKAALRVKLNELHAGPNVSPIKR